jgi:hypothetical protein
VTGTRAPRRAEGRALDTRRPDHGFGWQRCVAFEAQRIAIVARHLRAQPYFDAHALQCALRFARQSRGKREQNTIHCLNQQHAHGADVQRGIILAHNVSHQFGDRAREFYAGRAAADHHKPQQTLPLQRIGLVDGALKAGDQMVADRQRVGHVLEFKAVGGDFVQAEEIGCAARRNDQFVVGDFGLVGDHHPPLTIDRTHRCQPELHVAEAAHHRPHRLRDLLGFQSGGCHLVQQRPEAVVVVAIDQQHVHRRIAQSARRRQPRKARADNNNTRTTDWLW